jgi:hypothetical protein
MTHFGRHTVPSFACVSHGGTASGVVFSSGGILQVDASSHLSGTISGFHLGEEIDLRGLAFSSSSSTLTWKQTTSRSNRRIGRRQAAPKRQHIISPGRLYDTNEASCRCAFRPGRGLGRGHTTDRDAER